MRRALLLCDGCGKEPERFADVIRVYWPRHASDGRSLDPIVGDYCSHRCLQVALRQKPSGDGVCRPWCAGVALGQPVCDCVEDHPALDRWEGHATQPPRAYENREEPLARPREERTPNDEQAAYAEPCDRGTALDPKCFSDGWGT